MILQEEAKAARELRSGSRLNELMLEGRGAEFGGGVEEG